MVDKVEAQKNLESLQSDLKHLAALNHLNSRYEFKCECRKRMDDIEKQIKNIKWQLSG